MGTPCFDAITSSNGRLHLPEGYRPYIGPRETHTAVARVADFFQRGLATALNLTRVSAPIVVLSRTGVNDYLSGVEKPISFQVTDMGEPAEVVQSLAKWKRMALADYGFGHGEGLFTNMNAIRPDERLDNLHSVYVDQWDWERVISEEERNLEFLKQTVRTLYALIRDTERQTCQWYPQLPGPYLPEEIHFVHSEELAERYPDLPPEQRENAICSEKGAVFIIGIGANLKDGKPHGGRAADYDDWSTENGQGRRGLNGDIVVWYPVLRCAFEISSMGIRVDREALLRQLRLKGEEDRVNLRFHRRLLAGELPLSIGGGIGQSRLCMFMLRKAFIGEVQASVWPAEVEELCQQKQLPLL